MRKLKLTPLFLLASVFGLSACTLPSWLSFLSFIPGLEAPEKEEKKEEKKEEEEEEEEEETYSAEKVCEDFNAALEADGWPFGAEWDDDYEEYSFGAAFGAEDDDGNPYDESEECLKSVVDYVGSYLPEYLVYQFGVYEDPADENYYQMFQNDIIYYIAVYTTEDESVEVDVYSYLYGGDYGLVCFASIYDVAE